MKTDKQNLYKDLQIAIWNKERELHASTQKVLFDLLSDMSKDELKATGELGIEFEFDGTVVEAISPEGIYVEEGYTIALDDIPQREQKQIIDEILLNIFKI